MQRCLGCMKEYGKEYEICPFCGYMTDAVPTDKNHLIPGTILSDRYMLGKVIGHGGFGITYIAWDEKIQKKVAVKEYFPNAFSTRQKGLTEVSCYNEKAEKFFKEGMSKMLDEARRISRFSDNENIVDIYDYFEENNTAYIVMEYLEGEDLKKYLEKKGGKIDPEQAVKIILPVLNALKDMHREKLIHRDISPDNIYMCNNGKVKLLDFGAARLEVEDAEKSLSVMVKRGYAPKEQYISRSKQGPWTDVYAVCATMYKMITGEVPSESIERDDEPLKTFAEFGITGYDKLEETLFKGLEPNIQDRIQSVETLESLLKGEKVVEQKTTSPQITPKEQKSKKSIKIIAIFLACVIAMGALGTIIASIAKKDSNSTLDNALNIYATKLAEVSVDSAYISDINNDEIPEVIYRDYALGEQKIMTYSSKVGLCIQDLTTLSEEFGEIYFESGEDYASIGFEEIVELDCEDYGVSRPTLYEMDRYGFDGGYTLYGDFSGYDYNCYSNYAVTENVVEYLSDSLGVNFKNSIKEYNKQKERLYSLVDEKYEDEIIDFTCSDFDYDGTYEAFAAIDVNKTDLIGIDGIICFINCDGDVKELFKGNCAALDDKVSEQYRRYYQICDLNDNNCLGRTWYVDGKYVVEISELNNTGCQPFDFEERHPYFKDTLIATVVGNDFCSEDIGDDGLTYKNYYYYETDDGIKEYGGALITESDLQEMAYTEDEYEAIKQLINEYQMKVGEIYYRENGIININLSREESGVTYYHYLTVFYVDGHLWISDSDIESCNGNYAQANTPDLAEYFVY